VTDPDQPPRPGWLPDPIRHGRLRYFDGSEWTEHIHVLAEPDESVASVTSTASLAPATSPTTPSETDSVIPHRSFEIRATLLFVALVLAILGIVLCVVANQMKYDAIDSCRSGAAYEFELNSVREACSQGQNAGKSWNVLGIATIVAGIAAGMAVMMIPTRLRCPRCGVRTALLAEMCPSCHQPFRRPNGK